MQGFLLRIGMRREEVVALGESASHAARAPCIRSAAAGRSHATAGAERVDGGTVQAALANVSVIEAANAEEEALAIAVALREAVEQPARPRRW